MVFLNNGNIIKHVRARDIAFRVDKYFYVKEKDLFKLKGAWINIAYMKEFVICTAKLEIKRGDLKKWKMYEPRNVEI